MNKCEHCGIKIKPDDLKKYSMCYDCHTFFKGTLKECVECSKSDVAWKIKKNNGICDECYQNILLQKKDRCPLCKHLTCTEQLSQDGICKKCSNVFNEVYYNTLNLPYGLVHSNFLKSVASFAKKNIVIGPSLLQMYINPKKN